MSWEWRHIEDPTDGWKRLRCPDKGKCMPIKTGQLRTDGWIWGYLAAFWVFGPSCYPGPEVSLAMNTNCLFVWLKMVTATLKGSLLSEFTLIIIYPLFHYFCLSFSLVNLFVCSFNYQYSLVSSISYPFFFHYYIFFLHFVWKVSTDTAREKQSVTKWMCSSVETGDTSSGNTRLQIFVRHYVHPASICNLRPAKN